MTLPILLTAPAPMLTVSGRDYVDRPTREFGAELDCRGIPCVYFNTPVARTTAQNRCIQFSVADETATTIPARDLREGLKHITWSRRRPLVRSDVELRPRTTHGSLGPKGSRSRPAAPAAHSQPVDPDSPSQVLRPAVHHGACCPEPAMHSRRWRSGSVGPPDPGRGCPELVKPTLITDIGVCMSQHRSWRASRVEE